MLSTEKVASRDWEVAETEDDFDERLLPLWVARFSEEPRESRGAMWRRNCFLMGEIQIKNEESENHWIRIRA